MFDKPESPPEPKSGGLFENPIGREIYFKSGKAQVPAIKGKISAADLNVKFTCREGDYEEGVKASYIQLDKMTLYVLGVFSRFAGQDYNEASPKDSERYTSTIYRSPKDPIFFRVAGVKDVRSDKRFADQWTAGDYHQVRAFCDMQSYRDKVGYKKIAVCWCDELNDVVEIIVSRKIEYGIAQAIAVSTGTPRNPRRVDGLTDLQEFWAFQFNGDFVEVDEVKGKPCEDFSGKKEWVFAPVFPACGVIRKDGKFAEKFALLTEKQADVDAYVDSQIEWAASIVAGGSTEEAQKPTPMQTAAATAQAAGFVPDHGFPVADLTSHKEAATDDLPF